MNENKIELFTEEQDCCGCGACMNVCPRNAITMQENKQGFLYPVITPALCIGCNLCSRVCAYQKENRQEKPVQTAWAAAAKDAALVKKSASGGIFAAAARYVLWQGGIVYGCSMENVQQSLRPMHIAVEREEDLVKLQGSKYVQSDMGTTYSDVKQMLHTGRRVLFSGTPCQVAGLRAFLGSDYENLITIDIICHGVPSDAFFQGYIQTLEKKLGGRIVDFKFRDKSSGWDYKMRVTYEKNGKLKDKLIPVGLSSYYKLFLESDLCRESCYSCVYAKGSRSGDWTIGDYWKIDKQHPEALTKNGGNLEEEEGISCILVNTEQGAYFLKELAQDLKLNESAFRKVAEINDQLRHPSVKTERHGKVMELFEQGGYEAVERWYNKSLGWKRLAYYGWYKLPRSIRSRLKKH